VQPVICLIGPTASGKTALAFALADRYPVHLISVDSAQIYRGMNIGSAKPTAEGRERGGPVAARMPRVPATISPMRR